MAIFCLREFFGRNTYLSGGRNLQYRVELGFRTFEGSFISLAAG